MTMTDSHRLEAIKWLSRMGGVNPTLDDVAVGIINMGKALDTATAPALVEIKREADISTFQLRLDVNHFDKFSSEHKAGVLFHELNHILFKHLAIQTSDDMPDQQILTIAQEIQCNDTVLHHGVDLPYMNPDSQDGIFYGEKIVGQNCFGMSIKEIYDLVDDNRDKLPENPDNETHVTVSGGDGNGDGNDNGDGNQNGNQNGDGNDNGDGCQVCSGGEHMDADDLSDILDAITRGMSGDDPADNITGQETNPDSDQHTTGGNGHKTLGAVSAPQNISFVWDDIIRNMRGEVGEALGMAQARYVDDWRFTPRNLTGVLEESMRMPTVTIDNNGDDNASKPKIILMVDQSGSIPLQVAEKARELAVSIPRDAVDVEMFVFASYVAQMDIDTGEVDGDMGFGTDFDEILAHVEKNSEPVNVVVFTDGYSRFTELDDSHMNHPAGWHWVNIVGEPQDSFNNTVANAIGDVDELMTYNAEME